MRVQLTVLYVAALGLLLTGAGLLVYHSLFNLLLRTTDATLATEAAQVTSQLVPASDGASRKTDSDNAGTTVAQRKLTTVDIPGLVTDPEYLRVARADTGQVLALSPRLQKEPALAAALAALPLPSRNRPRYAFAVPSEEDQMRCLTIYVPERDYLLQVATTWDATEDLLTELAQSLTGMIALFLILSGVGSWILVGRAFHPIDEIVTEAERLTADRMSPVLLRPRRHSDDEVGHLTDALNGMMTRLYDAFVVQRRFTADASHELRTPLTILQGELELALARERPAEAYRETLSSSLEETRRMTRIVESLALLARADAGQSDRRLHARTRIAVEPLVSEVASLYADRAAVKDVRLDFRLSETALWINGDQDTLELAFGNLLDNAITYTPPGGTITVETALAGRNVRITVADTGVGIAPEDLAHVFERFYRADRARVNTGGSGLGLAIVQSVVEAHGGSVAVESAPSRETRFLVTLPEM